MRPAPSAFIIGECERAPPPELPTAADNKGWLKRPRLPPPPQLWAVGLRELRPDGRPRRPGEEPPAAPLPRPGDAAPAVPQTRTEGTVTKGAVNFAQICATLANTMDLHSLLLPTNLVNVAQIRLISRKFGKCCCFPHFLDLHPHLLRPRLFGSKRYLDVFRPKSGTSDQLP